MVTQASTLKEVGGNKMDTGSSTSTTSMLFILTKYIVYSLYQM